ncbi:MAG TPA: hypothetical protein VFI91_08675 [Longimicrobiaceae bacterium]|nr:hypothetical protein [Longimicrobiaceae bacterium]
MKAYRFVDLARDELFEASERYEARAVGLGDDFLVVISSTISLLRENPELGASKR